jgi:hypothetical protein
MKDATYSVAFGKDAPSGVGLETLHDLENVPDVVYEDVLNEFDWVWRVKGLIIIIR